MDEEPRVPGGARFAFDTALRALDQRTALIDSLEAKAAMLLAGSGIFAGFLFTSDPVLLRAAAWAARLSAIALVLSGGLLVWTLLPRFFSAGAEPRKVAEMVGDSPDLLDERFTWWFLPNVIEALEKSDRRLKRKRSSITMAGALLVLAVGMMGVSFGTAGAE